jgi:hypothetical protein
MVILLCGITASWLTLKGLAITLGAYDEGLGGKDGVKIKSALITSDPAGDLGGRTALIKKQALRHIEQTIRNIDDVLEGEDPLTASEEAELTYFSWHLIASLSRWKRRHGRMAPDVTAEYPTPR